MQPFKLQIVLRFARYSGQLWKITEVEFFLVKTYKKNVSLLCDMFLQKRKYNCHNKILQMEPTPIKMYICSLFTNFHAGHKMSPTSL